MTCRISINGEPRDVDEPTTLAELVAALGTQPQSVATALNGDFVPRTQRDSVTLREGDAVFTFQPITGG